MSTRRQSSRLKSLTPAPPPFDCSNCGSKIIPKNIKEVFTELIYSKSELPNSSKVTILDALLKVFMTTIDSYPDLLNTAHGHDLRLCHKCGTHLWSLFKYFERFTQLCAPDSKIGRIFGIPTGQKLSSRSQKNSVQNYEEVVSPLTSSGQHNLVVIKTESVDESSFDEEYFSRGVSSESSSEFYEESADFQLEDVKPILSPETAENIPSNVNEIVETEENSLTVECLPEVSPTDIIQYDGKKLELSLGLELRKVNGRYPNVCPICKKLFGYPSRMRLHLTLNHFIECGVPPEKIQRYKTRVECEICFKTCANKQCLTKHVELVHNKINKTKKFKCNFCDKMFALKSHVKVHEDRIHINPGSEKEKTFLCSVCGKAFTTKGNLKGHYNLHFSETREEIKRKRQLHCEICGRVSSTITHYKDHLLVHAGQRTFTCDTCGKSFNTRKCMKKHASAHTDSFKCPLCERSFPRKTGLRDHLISKTHLLSIEEAKKMAWNNSTKLLVVDQD